MANVAHSTLTGSNLHENKGVASASDNTVATASSGSTVWQKLTHNHLTTTGNPFGAQLFHIRDGGALSLSAASWQTRPLTTIVTNEISSASLTSNQISLPAGTYHIQSNITGRLIMAYSTSNYIQARLRNITTSADLLYSNVINHTGSLSFNAGAGVSVNTNLTASVPVAGRFTLAGTSTLEIQTYHSTGTQDSAEVVSGIPIINTQLYIWKIA